MVDERCFATINARIIPCTLHAAVLLIALVAAAVSMPGGQLPSAWQPKQFRAALRGAAYEITVGGHSTPQRPISSASSLCSTAERTAGVEYAPRAAPPTPRLEGDGVDSCAWLHFQMAEGATEPRAPVTPAPRGTLLQPSHDMGITLLQPSHHADDDHELDTSERTADIRRNHPRTHQGPCQNSGAPRLELRLSNSSNISSSNNSRYYQTRTLRR